MKKITMPVMAAVLSAGLFMSAPAYAYDNGPHYNGNGQSPGGNYPEYGGQKPGGNQSQIGAQKRLISIDRQLQKIEELIGIYSAKLPGYSNKKKSYQSVYALQEQPADEEDLAGELEQEVTGYSDYKGKFISLGHRLDGIARQLDSLGLQLTDQAALDQRRAKIEELRAQVESAQSQVSGVQQTVTDKIEAETDAKVEPEAGVDDSLKPWRIHFNKPLDEQALSELHVVVVDRAGNLVVTETTYDEVAHALVITPMQAYQKGEKYTLFIDKAIKSQSGKTLKKSIKKVFYIK